jgi:hypothetical protein
MLAIHVLLIGLCFEYTSGLLLGPCVTHKSSTKRTCGVVGHRRLPSTSSAPRSAPSTSFCTTYTRVCSNGGIRLEARRNSDDGSDSNEDSDSGSGSISGSGSGSGSAKRSKFSRSIDDFVGKRYGAGEAFYGKRTSDMSDEAYNAIYGKKTEDITSSWNTMAMRDNAILLVGGTGDLVCGSYLPLLTLL